MVELPERFKQRIKEQLGEEYEAYLLACEYGKDICQGV